MSGHKAYLAMFVIQVIYSGMILLSKAVLNNGMKSTVFIFYRQLIGALILVPLAFIFERKSAVSLSFVMFCKIFGLSFLGITLSLNVYAIALVNTSATLGAAIVSCIPVFTFFFAVLLRMEKVKIRTKLGMTKIGGVIVCMGGVATLAFYKGPHISAYHLHHHHYNSSSSSSAQAWYLGSLLLVFSIITWSIWLVLQAGLLISYPSKLRFTSLQCLLSAIQSFGIAIASERDIQQWRLGWNIRLLAVLYCGAMVTGMTFYLQMWVIEKKGPVFSAMWNPLNFIITIIGSMFLLGESVTLGSIVGGILLVLSLYSVLWAKSKEGRMMGEVEDQISLPIQQHKEFPNFQGER